MQAEVKTRLYLFNLNHSEFIGLRYNVDVSKAIDKIHHEIKNLIQSPGQWFDLRPYSSKRYNPLYLKKVETKHWSRLTEMRVVAFRLTATEESHILIALSHLNSWIAHEEELQKGSSNVLCIVQRLNQQTTLEYERSLNE